MFAVALHKEAIVMKMLPTTQLRAAAKILEGDGNSRSSSSLCMAPIGGPL